MDDDDLALARLEDDGWGSAITSTPSRKAPTAFQADLARFDKAFRAAGAIRTDPDGFAWVDAAKVPVAMLRAFRGLMEYGYANGLL